MHKGRLEAFSDGVIAIIITIMVLEFKLPEHSSGDVTELAPLIPVFWAYVLSFIYLGIYWSNHHHLFQAAKRINGTILWANMLLLFWLTLIPFTTAWVGQNPNASWPAAIYGIVLLFAGASYVCMSHILIEQHGSDSILAKALGSDIKGRISVTLYALAIPLAFVKPAGSYVVYAIVALMWLVPDRRIEKMLE
jgi:uncharacterized membrane protein